MNLLMASAIVVGLTVVAAIVFAYVYIYKSKYKRSDKIGMSVVLTLLVIYGFFLYQNVLFSTGPMAMVENYLTRSDSVMFGIMSYTIFICIIGSGLAFTFITRKYVSGLLATTLLSCLMFGPEFASFLSTNLF